MEPETLYREVTKAKLKVGATGASKLHQQEPFLLRKPLGDPIKETLHQVASEPSLAIVKARRLPAISPQRGLSLTMKQEIFKQPEKNRNLYKEVALVLDDLCNTVAQGKSIRSQPRSPVMNRYVEEQKEQQEKDIRESLEAEKRRKAHSLQLKAKLKIAAQQKEEQAKISVSQTPQKSPGDKKEFEWKRLHDEQFKRVKDYQVKRQKEKEIFEVNNQEAKKKEVEVKKAQFKEFNSRRIAEMVCLRINLQRADRSIPLIQ